MVNSEQCLFSQETLIKTSKVTHTAEPRLHSTKGIIKTVESQLLQFTSIFLELPMATLERFNQIKFKLQVTNEWCALKSGVGNLEGHS